MAASDLSTRGGRLKWARECAGYRTAKAFWEKFQIAQGTYSLHESNDRGIRPDIAEKYAGHLENCSAAWILYGKGEPPRPIGTLPGGTVAGRGANRGRSQEEEDAFAFLYDELLKVAQENDESILREFGIVLERYGFEGDIKGIGKLAFHIFKKAQEEGGATPLVERVVQRVARLQEAMNDLKESMRKMARLIDDSGHG